MFAVVAPGQGSQTPGMLTAWLRDPSCAERVRAWSEAADCDLAYLGTKAPAAEISRTEHTQPLLVAAGLLAVTRLLAERPIDTGPANLLAAGHSVGELTAAACAGALSPADAVRLAAIRGQAMAAACAEAPTSMSAVVGGEEHTVLDRLAELELSAATFNGAGQIVAAGLAENLARLAAAPPAGATVKPLAVAGAFHTRFMESARTAFAAAVAATEFRPCTHGLLSNADGALVSSPEQVRQRLVDQLVLPVRWDRCMAAIGVLEPDLVVSLPPAKTLTNIFKRQLPSLTVLPINTPRDVATVETRLASATREGEPVRVGA